MPLPVVGRRHTYLTRLDDLRAVVRAYTRPERAGDPLYLDTESTGLNPRRDRLVLVQLRQGDRPTVLVDWRRATGAWWDALAELLADTSGVVVGHNLKHDLGFIRQALGDIPLLREPARLFDTQLAEQVLLGVGYEDARNVGGVGLRATYDRYRDPGRHPEMSKEERAWFVGLDRRPAEWAAPIPAEQLAYAALDVDALAVIHGAQDARLDARDLRRTFRLEMAVLPALVRMEARGIRVMADEWRRFIAEKDAEAKAFEAEALGVFGQAIVDARIEEYDRRLAEWQRLRGAYEAYASLLRQEWEGADESGHAPCEREPWGRYKQRKLAEWRAANPIPPRPKLDCDPPNIGSPQQLLTAFARLGIPASSTKSEVLKQLDHPAVATLLKYRKAAKFVQSFGEALLAKGEEEPGVEGLVIHPDYQQIGASTGRMSCRDPNWQQVPSKGDGKRLRRLVVARPGHKLIVADFSNIEARVLADVSGDETLLGIFARGEDLHAATARLMFGLPEGWGKEETANTACPLAPGWSYRDLAKTINYGLFFGMSEAKLARTLQQPREVGEQLMARYFSVLPGVKRYLAEARRAAVTRGETKTLLGRVRSLRLPAEPTKPQRPGDDEGWRAYRALLREYRAQRARVERQGMNSPIQGTAADIAKYAVADFDRRAHDGIWLVAVVHDELVAEAPDHLAELAKTYLEASMDEAARHFLTRVALPPTDAVISEYWEHN